MLKRFLAIRIDEILSLLIFLLVNKIILHNQLEKITYVTPLPGTINLGGDAINAPVFYW